MRIYRVVFLCVFFFTFFSTVEAQEPEGPPILGFEGAEHIAAGDKIKLQFQADVEGKTGVKLKLKNGLELTYGEIVALAGDFYGDPVIPISSGKTDQEQKKYFLQNYKTLAIDAQAVTEVPKIMTVMQYEKQQVQKGIENGENVSDVYARISTDDNIAWNCITGGLCPDDYPDAAKEFFRKIYFLKQGRFLKLADRNFDHYGQHAWLAYSTGHQLALETAIQAHHDQDPQKLEEAYVINAFASHFFSDSFSAGHMRAPRLELYNSTRPSTIGSLLTIYMHQEDSEAGLVVSNRRGDTWKAYGDAYYFDPRNKQNVDLLQEAMQLSVDEIFSAYLTGQLPTENKVFAIVPDFDKLTEHTSKTNTAPLFYWDEKTKTVYRRARVDYPYDYHWVVNGSGLITLLALIHARGTPGNSEAILLLVNKKENITDKEILRFNTVR